MPLVVVTEGVSNVDVPAVTQVEAKLTAADDVTSAPSGSTRLTETMVLPD